MKKTLSVLLFLLIIFSVNCYCQFSMYLEEKIPINAELITATKISKDSRFLACGTEEGKIYIWDTDAKRIIHQFDLHKKDVTSFCFDSKNKYLVSGSDDEDIIIWDLYLGEKIKILDDFRDDINYLELSPDDRTLVVCGDKKEIALYEFPSGVKKGDLKDGHKKDVIYASFNLNGNEIVTIGEDEQMIFWNPSQLKKIRKNELSPNTMNNSGIDIISVQTSFDKQIIGVGYQERKLAKGGRKMIFKYNLAFYEWKTGKLIEILENNNKDINFFCITPDKKYILTDNSTLRENKISFWNLHKGIIEKNYPFKGSISALDLSKDGNYLTIAYTEDKNFLSSYLSLFKLSGIDGFERFNYDNKITQTQDTGFGSSIKITTPKEPIFNMGESKKLAVIYFDNMGVPLEVAKTTTYILESKLSNSSQLYLIERNQIEKVVSELKYQLSGLTKSDAVEIGKQLNAEYILIGSINKLGNLLIITAKIVNIETAQIEGTREVQCSNARIEDISDMVSSLASIIAKF